MVVVLASSVSTFKSPLGTRYSKMITSSHRIILTALHIFINTSFSFTCCVTVKFSVCVSHCSEMLMLNDREVEATIAQILFLLKTLKLVSIG